MRGSTADADGAAIAVEPAGSAGAATPGCARATASPEAPTPAAASSPAGAAVSHRRRAASTGWTLAATVAGSHVVYRIRRLWPHVRHAPCLEHANPCGQRMIGPEAPRPLLFLGYSFVGRSGARGSTARDLGAELSTLRPAIVRGCAAAQAGDDAARAARSPSPHEAVRRAGRHLRRVRAVAAARAVDRAGLSLRAATVVEPGRLGLGGGRACCIT